MALRDWSASRILGIWTAWMAGLLVALLAGVVFSPDGVVTITLSGVGSSLAMRAAFGVFGLAAACLPPAIVTYAWYVGRVREWVVVHDGMSCGTLRVTLTRNGGWLKEQPVNSR